MRDPNAVFLDLQTGASHPHGQGQPRPQRRQTRQPATDVSAFQRQLTEARHAAEISEMASKQQEDRISRLENIIADFVELLSFPGGVPGHIQRAIEQDAPAALRASRNGGGHPPPPPFSHAQWSPFAVPPPPPFDHGRQAFGADRNEPIALPRMVPPPPHTDDPGLFDEMLMGSDFQDFL